MAILYAYFVRIIVQGELPRGKLTWMIAAFGSVGIVTKLLAYPIRNSGTRLLAWFDRYYYYALLIPIILLGIAIGVRIRDYGVTEQRYTVVLMAVWFTSVALLTMFLQDRFHIKYVPMILALLLLGGSFGPWSAMQVSIRSQAGRLEGLMKKYQLLQNGQLVPGSNNIPFMDRKRMSSILDYLCASDERYERIRPWFSKALARSVEKHKSKTLSGRCPNGGSRNLVKLMGFDYVNHWQTEDKAGSFSYSNPEYLYNKQLFNVSGFDYIGRGTTYRYSDRTFKHVFQVQRHGKQEKLTLSRVGENLIVSAGGGDKVIFEIGSLIRQLRKEKISVISPADSDRLTLNAGSTNGRLRARLILEQIQGSLPAGQQLGLSYVSYTLMLKFIEP